MQSSPLKPSAKYAAVATGVVMPGALYTLTSAMTASGISRTRIAQEARRGNELRKFRVGKRTYVSGSDLIDFIIRAAARQEKRRDGLDRSVSN